MQPHAAMWKPNPQPSRTNVMTVAVCCGRTDENGEACTLMKNGDASTPHVRTTDNLLNIDTSLEHCVVLLESEAHGVDPVTVLRRVFFADG
jgi:hypothetical protein